MAIKFTDLQGRASKAGPPRFTPAIGVNKIRIIGNVIPAYKYWLRTRDNSPVPMECLGFNRDSEQFENKVQDWVRFYHPDMKCSWAYASYIIDRTDGKVKLFDHKKKLFEAILNAAQKKMGDPTDPVKGWDIVFTKEKTGPKVFNIEYRLETFELTNSPLSKDDLAAVEAAGVIEDISTQQTPDEQHAFLKGYILPKEEEVEPDVERELNTNNDDLI